jgi:hypothetical protein
MTLLAELQAILGADGVLARAEELSTRPTASRITARVRAR